MEFTSILKAVLSAVILGLAVLGLLLLLSTSILLGFLAAMGVVLYLLLYVALEKPHQAILTAISRGR